MPCLRLSSGSEDEDTVVRECGAKSIIRNVVGVQGCPVGAEYLFPDQSSKFYGKRARLNEVAMAMANGCFVAEYGEFVLVLRRVDAN